MNSCPFDVGSLIWMKTQLIMITSTIKSTPNHSGMEFCVNFKPESIHADSKLKNLKFTPIDFGVESSIKYSKLELFLVDSKLEFVVE
jgi:hypothetical protein